MFAGWLNFHTRSKSFGLMGFQQKRIRPIGGLDWWPGVVEPLVLVEGKWEPPRNVTKRPGSFWVGFQGKPPGNWHMSTSFFLFFGGGGVGLLEDAVNFRMT